MGKESKELLRKILSNQKLIMAHLKIKEPVQSSAIYPKPVSVKKPARKAPEKKHKK